MMKEKKTDYLEFYILKKRPEWKWNKKHSQRKKRMEFVSCKPALKEVSKVVLQAEGEIYQKEICVYGVKEKQ